MKRVLSIMFCLIFLAMAFFVAMPTNINAATIIVPDHYPTIQQAIDNAVTGGTIFVRAGTYDENVVVSKSINLIGENKATTIIDGNNLGDVVQINTDWVNVTGFTVIISLVLGRDL